MKQAKPAQLQPEWTNSYNWSASRFYRWCEGFAPDNFGDLTMNVVLGLILTGAFALVLTELFFEYMCDDTTCYTNDDE